MTLAVRRTTSTLLAVLAATLLSLALFAGPAVAADEGEHAAQTQAAGFGSAQWDGMILAAVAGLVIGGLAFALSRPGDITRVDAHHDAPKGDQQMAS